MAMRGLTKGHGGYSNGSRWRPYGMMLLLAFGAAIIGLMVLHMFRERRIFNLLIKEKDTDLISLQLLLQKERDRVKDAKWKLEDMRAKMRTLRAQKRELDNRIMEMQSTVTSLGEEQKIIESTLEEKQNEIMMLRDKNISINNENPKVTRPETLKQKESEIENLKYRDESPGNNVWSVSTDDPSDTSLKSQIKTRMIKRDETNDNQGNESSAVLNAFTNHEVGEILSKDAYRSSRDFGNRNAKGEGRRRENGGETAEIRETNGKQSQKQDNSKESKTEERNARGEGRNNGKSLNGGEELKMAKREAIVNQDNEVWRPKDDTNEEHNSGDKVSETTGDGVPGRTSTAQDAENQEHGTILKGGMKLDIPNNSQLGRHRRKIKSGNLKRAKGKRWTIMARSTAENSENNGVAVMSDKGSVQGTSAETLENSSLSLRNETGAEDPGMMISDKLQKGEASEHEDSKDVGQEAINTASNKHIEERERRTDTIINTEATHISLKDAPTNMSLQIDATKASFETEQQKVPEVAQSVKEATGVQRLVQEITSQKDEEVSEQTKTPDFDEQLYNSETENPEEEETETERSTESTSNLEADGEERKGKKDEPEF